jgi:hypothetical protein
MTDIKLGSNNDFVIEDGSFLLITETSELVRQRLLNKLRAFTGTLFTNVDYGVDQTLFFERGTKSLLDQNLKTLISETQGIISLVSFESSVGTDRFYRCSFVYSTEVGEIEGIDGLTLGANGTILDEGIWKDGRWVFTGTWQEDEIWGSD